ncbi:MAG: hypothetical protein JO287_09380 [Pseudonocardiales bacterium]|nr:hypothetical protein [Pseudonocardiales bacterium]
MPREHSEFTATRQAHARFRTASVVKLLIALDYLIQHDPELGLDKTTTDEQRMDILTLRTMLRPSPRPARFLGLHGHLRRRRSEDLQLHPGQGAHQVPGLHHR